MIRLEDILNVNNLNEMRRDGYIRQAKHPSLPLVSECYTKQTMWEQAWTNETRICRGLIWNTETKEVVARPFAKFFNYGEPSCPEIDLDEFVQVYNKLDGSLGIVYNTPDGPAVATKNSFTSPQALHATEVLRTRYSTWRPRPGVTSLFQIVYPGNRIVLDYHQVDDLFFLGGVWNDTGATRLYDQWALSKYEFPEAEMLMAGAFRDVVSHFQTLQRPNAEGVVIHAVNPDIRVKVKQQDYLELHKVCTGMNKKALWKMLSEGRGIPEILMDLPEELHDWALPIMQDLCHNFTDLDMFIAESWAVSRLEGLDKDRKKFAEAISGLEKWMQSGLWNLFDGHEDRYNKFLWSQVMPSGEKR